ncbi:MAG TPA: 50S ribosomal protein L11 methyltransferase [Edaphocola sp.]|nr:50S ribosomal protein L11 methyltransferase [Edaphocola sp.]
MNYIKIEIKNPSTEALQLFLGALGTLDAVIGVEELENDILLAYTQEWESISQQVLGLGKDLEAVITISELEDQNWNASWESNFEPVVIPGFVSVRAYFHEPIAGVQYDIKITPKMSFGTGHHATTKLMMKQMQNIDFLGKNVFDYGTGTGILAVLAEFLGAKHVDAIDIDEWSYENALENISNNKCKNINVAQSDISWLQNCQKYDVVLANINRHILLESMGALNRCLNANGQLLLSGILKLQDTHIIVEKATENGFQLMKQTEEDGWTAVLFEKQKI